VHIQNSGCKGNGQSDAPANPFLMDGIVNREREKTNTGFFLSLFFLCLSICMLPACVCVCLPRRPPLLLFFCLLLCSSFSREPHTIYIYTYLLSIPIYIVFPLSLAPIPYTSPTVLSILHDWFLLPALAITPTSSLLGSFLFFFLPHLSSH
jgi:hypothetical protein